MNGNIIDVRLTYEKCQKCNKIKYVDPKDEICPKCKGWKILRKILRKGGAN